MNQPHRPIFVSFVAGASGTWRVDRVNAVIGDGLPLAERLAALESTEIQETKGESPVLRGVTSNLRYTNAHERDTLLGRQHDLHRSQATRAALIPIRKTQAWWALAQDQRRSIFEEQSHHLGIGLEYLPAIARRLHHSRELGEPFDFLTWSESAPDHGAAFEELECRLREAREWEYIDREVDIRLSRILEGTPDVIPVFTL
jgi:hypothetical protein